MPRIARSVLVVDDDAATREAIAEVLALHGWTVWPAPSADAALARLRDEPEPPRAMVLDVVMPGLSPTRLCDIVRSTPRWAAIRLVLVTALPAGALNPTLPVDEVLPKPFGAEQLCRAVDGPAHVAWPALVSGSSPARRGAR